MSRSFKSVRSVCSLSWVSNNKSSIVTFGYTWSVFIGWKIFHDNASIHLSLIFWSVLNVRFAAIITITQHFHKMHPNKLHSHNTWENCIFILVLKVDLCFCPIHSVLVLLLQRSLLYKVSLLSFSRVLALLPLTSPRWILLLFFDENDMIGEGSAKNIL